MKKIIIAIIMFASLIAKAQQTTIFNQDGYATHYIDQKSHQIFTFSGEPVAILVEENLYSAKGEHLGWYVDGVIRDHDGNISGFVKGAVYVISLHLEPLKGPQQYTFFSGSHTYPPSKPYFNNTWSRETIYALFVNHFSQPIITPTVSTNNNYTYNAKEHFVSSSMYTPNFQAIASNLESLQANYDRNQISIPAGYIYDAQMNKYYSPEQWELIKKARKTYLQSIQNLLYKTKLFNSTGKLKNGEYNAYYTENGNENSIVPSCRVTVKGNKLKSMYFPGRKRRFKGSTSIFHGICTASYYDKFGFLSDKISYPQCTFYIFEK